MSEERRYGVWAGNERGTSENRYRCIKEVPGKYRTFSRGHQCTRKRGYGPDGLYCKQHAKI